VLLEVRSYYHSGETLFPGVKGVMAVVKSLPSVDTYNYLPDLRKTSRAPGSISLKELESRAGLYTFPVDVGLRCWVEQRCLDLQSDSRLGQ
jgi:hypothetical protein